eukprot:jgi/Chrpa1/1615/Chrysochromulina_OHIO_Genome00010725-RA
MSKRELAVALFAEFVGTFLFQIFGGTEQVAAENGLVLAVCIVITAKASGGNLNPAVSAGLAVVGALPPMKAVLYGVVQVLGALCGAILAGVVDLDDNLDPVGFGHWGGENTEPGCHRALPNKARGAVFVLESLGTYLLVSTVCATAVAKPGFGTSICVAVGAVGQITGGFFNPARFLGPAIVFGCDLGNIWVYVPAQFFGGLLAGLTHKFVLAKEPVVQITSEAVSLSPLSLSHLHLNDRLYNNAHFFFKRVFHFVNCGGLLDHGTLVDTLLLSLSTIAFFLWWWGVRQDWLCGYGLLFLTLIALAMWMVNRELRARTSLEAAASRFEKENASLQASNKRLGSDLEMLKDTIGMIGNRGEDWLESLRLLHKAQKRENDRHALLLRGHARIVLLQLIQHFDLDKTMRLNTAEWRAAEAFLLAGFPDVNLGALKEKAAHGGVALSDLEPLLLDHLEKQGASMQLEMHQPRAQAALLQA